jgi:hypothetical protein
MVHVSYFAQIPDGQTCKRIIIELLSQSVRTLIQAEPEPIQVSVTSRLVGQGKVD